MCRIKTLAKIRGVSGQVGQMRQLTAQLKKNKDSTLQKINGLETQLTNVMGKIQVRALKFVCRMYCSLCNVFVSLLCGPIRPGPSNCALASVSPVSDCNSTMGISENSNLVYTFAVANVTRAVISGERSPESRSQGIIETRYESALLAINGWGYDLQSFAFRKCHTARNSTVKRWNIKSTKPVHGCNMQWYIQYKHSSCLQHSHGPQTWVISLCCQTLQDYATISCTSQTIRGKVEEISTDWHHLKIEEKTRRPCRRSGSYLCCNPILIA